MRPYSKYAFLVVALLCTLAVRSEELPRSDVNFIIVSDLGAFGGTDQKDVAATLGDVAEEYHPHAILNLGDTFHFWGVQSVDDPGWQSNFESIYTNPWLHSLWFCALGNHDYQGNTQALIDYSDRSRRWNMPARYYTKTFKSRGTEVEVIVLDTTPFLRRATTQPDIYPDACQQDTAAQTAWLEQQLASSTADWVIVAAHHPVYSSRPDGSGQRADIQSHIAPILLRHRPDFYISGDVHCFEHFVSDSTATTPAIDFVTCTSGSEAYPVPDPAKDALFTSGLSGFMTMAVGKDSATVTMLDKKGRTIYSYTKTKQPKVSNK